MNISQLLQNDEYGIVNAIGKRFGLSSEQVQKAMSWLVPALTGAMKRKATDPSDVDSIFQALRTGDHEKYIDDQNYLGRPETAAEGNAILSHIFGSKEVSRNVAERTSQETGVSSSIIEQILPYAASALMGMLSKKVAPKSTEDPGPDARNNLLSFLDSDRDGSIIDDMLGHAFNHFVRG
ncbi:DUF937 domain-containing protein [Mariniblastus sp.]|nr:DUF937 domain-containing protein [Mariniblastus sp.]